MSKLPSLLQEGSVKNIFGVRDEAPYIFQFSDRYSIFDWGAMPNELEQKGESLAVMADLLFRKFSEAQGWSDWKLPENLPQAFKDNLENSDSRKKLNNSGLSHHSNGLVSEDLETVAFGKRSRFLSVQPVKVIPPIVKKTETSLDWDYSAYQDKLESCIVPLEVIFRFGAPKGSSLLRRVAKNPDYCKELGLSQVPQAGEWFEQPVVEFSTKLEPSDRMLNYAEAQQIAGLSDAEFANLKSLNMLLALRLKTIFADIGLELWDGKFEFAFSTKDGETRDFQLIDSIGPDELRILKDGVHLSKEAIRQLYNNSEWHKAVQEAKEIAKQEANPDWKQVCIERLQKQPEKLSTEKLQPIVEMYPSLVNALANNFNLDPLFPESKNLNTVIQKLKELSNS